MSRALVLTLYRALLKECTRVEALYPCSLSLSIRAPVTGDAGSHHADALSGLEYQYGTLEQLLPNLEVLPQQLPLSLPAVRSLIRDNFKANKHVDQESLRPYTDQAFAALRAVPEQAYLESCSSTSCTDGVLIDVTSCFSHQDKDSWQAKQFGRGPDLNYFSYRVRITNQRSQPVRVSGREWIITHEDGREEDRVVFHPDNGVVGQTPTIPPGRCFEYHSTAVLSGDGPVPTGQMRGRLFVDLYDDDATSEPVQRVGMPIQPFRLSRRPEQ